MDRCHGNGLEQVARALNSAHEKLDAGVSLGAEEVRALGALRAAAPRESRLRVVPVLLAGAASILLVAAFFAVRHVVSPRGGGESPILLSMIPVHGTRAGGGWREGDPFVLEVTLPEDLHLVVLHLDARGKLDLVFPFQDAATGAWSLLGHASSRLPGGLPLSIPAAGFTMDLRIEGGGPGEDVFIAIASREAIGEAELLKFREDLRRRVAEARGSRTGGEAIAESLRSGLARQGGHAFGILRYRVEQP